MREAATRLGYRPNYLARNLRRRRTSLWLLIISDIENVFFTSVARGVEDVAVDNGFSVVLCNADEDEGKEARYAELAVAEQAAGVIISPHSSRTDLRPLTAARIPVVVVDRELEGGFDTVTSDSRQGAKVATEHLLAQGWVRPGCITGPRSAQTAMLRRHGYEEALRTAGIRTIRIAHEPFTIDGGRVATGRLVGSNRAPDALFVGNAALGLGVLQELRRRGLRPGTRHRPDLLRRRAMGAVHRPADLGDRPGRLPHGHQRCVDADRPHRWCDASAPSPRARC